MRVDLIPSITLVSPAVNALRERERERERERDVKHRSRPPARVVRISSPAYVEYGPVNSRQLVALAV